MAENNIVITSDSTCDLGEKLISERGIKIMPLTVILGADSFKDGINIEPEDIFSYFDRTGELPKTGAPSVSDYENFFAESFISTYLPKRRVRTGLHRRRRTNSAIKCT